MSFLREQRLRDGGPTIGDRLNNQTGQLGPRTQLHKRYIIQKTIGRGGMGAVYQAKDLRRRGTPCAIKEMSLSMVSAEERAQAIQNFKFEAKMLWGLSHPNLPAFTNFFSENQRYFLVMEYIDGKTLEDYLETQGIPFPERRVLRWAEQLCDVLAYLHSQNPPIIFRDMKPGNIMLTRQGHVKLIDFGIARFFRPLSGADTQILGTPGYAPPEQHGGAQTDERSDIYSLGVTLAHLLTNTLTEKVFGLKARDLRAINPHISLPVARALEKATALEPDMRFQSVKDFLRALRNAASFNFENGVATVPEELAELCARYPDEGIEYLVNGEIEKWLRDIGEVEIARQVPYLLDMYSDPLEALEEFLHIVVGPNARPRNQTRIASHNYHQDGSQAGGTQGTPVLDYSEDVEPGRHTGQIQISIPQSTTRLFSQHREQFVQVSPRVLDFGPVYPPGLSAPLTFTIRGHQGLYVSGKLKAVEPWIRLDQAEFDGMNTSVNVFVQTANLRSYSHYEGTIVVAPDGNEDTIAITIHADVQGYSTQSSRHQPGRTVTPDGDDDEDHTDYNDYIDEDLHYLDQQVEDEVEENEEEELISAPHTQPERDLDENLIAKYGSPGKYEHWEPVRVSPQQERRLRFAMAFTTAFMLAGFWYTWLTQLMAPDQPFLLPHPWFVLVLIGIIPFTVLGALIVHRNASWLDQDTIDKLVIGMTSVLGVLALLNLGWQLILGGAPGWLHLICMLVAGALGAACGTTNTFRRHGLSWTEILLHHSGQRRWPAMVIASLLCGLMGYFLTVGPLPVYMLFFGIPAGILIACSLVWQVDRSQHKQRIR